MLRKKIVRLGCKHPHVWTPKILSHLTFFGIIIMAIEIIMPKLGVDMQEGEIIEMEKKQEGDFVNEGDVILR